MILPIVDVDGRAAVYLDSQQLKELRARVGDQLHLLRMPDGSYRLLVGTETDARNLSLQEGLMHEQDA